MAREDPGQGQAGGQGTGHRRLRLIAAGWARLRRTLTPAWFFPGPEESGRVLSRRIRVVLTASIIAANAIGGIVVVGLGILVLPIPSGDASVDTVTLINGVAAAITLLVASVLGSWWGLRRMRSAREWLEEDRPPDPREREIILSGPRRIFVNNIIIWTLAAIGFGILNATFEFEGGLRVGVLVAFGGISTCAFVYLIAERQLRPAAARALAGGLDERRLSPGIKTRTLLAWATGSAIPLLGLVIVGTSALSQGDFTRNELALIAAVLGVTGVIVGAYAIFLATRAISDPVVALSDSIDRVREGDLDSEVTVYDASEIGRLQAGFNEMLAGLRERERIEDLFGRHVGQQVAKAALEEGIELGGETREVAVLFVDVIGSTTLAIDREPQEVVELLNEFFTVVVDTVNRHDGWINKFEGDAALAVFGAPVPLPDAETKALAAARELAARLRDEVELDAGVGVSAGTVVAGNVGEERRFEYTVIGDPVNEAARLTELAKDEPGRVVASSQILDGATADERGRWQLGREVELRGRRQPTRIASPKAASD